MIKSANSYSSKAGIASDDEHGEKVDSNNDLEEEQQSHLYHQKYLYGQGHFVNNPRKSMESGVAKPGSSSGGVRTFLLRR